MVFHFSLQNLLSNVGASVATCSQPPNGLTLSTRSGTSAPAASSVSSTALLSDPPNSLSITSFPASVTINNMGVSSSTGQLSLPGFYAGTFTPVDVTSSVTVPTHSVITSAPTTLPPTTVTSSAVMAQVHSQQPITYASMAAAAMQQHQLQLSQHQQSSNNLQSQIGFVQQAGHQQKVRCWLR
ncbi:unnamed protein product [Protopolystoma xenopodis]|uniref:Uncharacterized protein n=1 Tax=Protopolystoma xenopodis TaxID=117903 RepID=A0A3S5ALZ8_9PLAT|nr:unnamed protein product [Protopolystoma xenopodis]